MNEKTRLAIGILGASVVLGLVGNFLLWASDWGLNMALWLLVAVAAAVGLKRWGKVERLPGEPWIWGAVLFFAFAFAWRDTPWLRTLDVLVLGVALSLPFWRSAAGGLRRALVGDAVVGGGQAALASIGGWAFALDPEVKWSEVGQAGAWRHGIGVALGLAIAAPLLLVFGGLFMSADAQFDKLIRGTFSMNLEDWIGHAFLIAFLAWGTGGFLYGLLASRGLNRVALPRVGVGIVAVATVLVMLDMLFGAFVALQLPYLFGGASTVAQSAGLTVAEYARRGFFELVWVTTLALPLLLALHSLVGEASPRAERVFQVLAGLMLALLGVIIASAVQRMLLYQAEFGWTTARLFVLAFEFWLAGVLIWFGATVLRGKREAFLFGAIAWGMVAAAVMHVPNWEGMIVRHNVSLAEKGRQVDVNYFNELSLDAVPALAEALPKFQDQTGRDVAHTLKRAYEEASKADWRSWRWAQHAAKEAVKPTLPTVEAYTQPVYGPNNHLYGRDWRDDERMD